MSRINSIIAELEKQQGEYLIVSKSDLLSALDALAENADYLTRPVKDSSEDLKTVDIMGDSFKHLIVNAMRTLNIVQNVLAAEANIDQGDLSKFLSGRQNFRRERRIRIHDAILRICDQKRIRADRL